MPDGDLSFMEKSRGELQGLLSGSPFCRLSRDLLEPWGLHVDLPQGPQGADSLRPSTPWIMTSLRRAIGEVLIDQVRPRWRRCARTWHESALRVSNSWPQKSQSTVGGGRESAGETPRWRTFREAHFRFIHLKSTSNNCTLQCC